MIITYEHEFPMGHRLPLHDGKCRYLHGHNYRVISRLSGRIDNATGFVMDFSDFKKAVRSVFENYDHAMVLQSGDPCIKGVEGFARIITTPFPPTAENLAIMWRDEIIRTLNRPVMEVKLTLQVWETSACSASTE